MNVQSSGRSATLTGTPRAPASRCTAASTPDTPVATITSAAPVEVTRREGHGFAAAAVAFGQLRERGQDGRRHHARQRAGLHQQLGLAQRHLAAADDERGASAHVEEDRQVVHGAPQGSRIVAAPFIHGRSAAGTVTLPSAFW